VLGSMDFEYELLLCLGPMHIQDGSNTLAIFIYTCDHLKKEQRQIFSSMKCVRV
jgi:hypothetical protein